MKDVLRKHCKTKRNQISKKCDKDEAIFHRFISSEQYKHAKRILIYVSLPNEVDTHKIIKHSLTQDKQVFVPKVISKDKMIICRINSFDELKASKSNILEPLTSIETDPNLIQLIVVPGLAFTKNGYRLGYGGGYYDRLLKQVDCSTVGFCYEKCILDDIPIEAHDMPVDFVLTEEREFIIWGKTA